MTRLEQSVLELALQANNGVYAMHTLHGYTYIEEDQADTCYCPSILHEVHLCSLNKRQITQHP